MYRSIPLDVVGAQRCDCATMSRVYREASAFLALLPSPRETNLHYRVSGCNVSPLSTTAPKGKTRALFCLIRGMPKHGTTV
jgi:hypothetical protein